MSRKFRTLAFLFVANMGLSFSQTLPPLQISRDRVHFVTEQNESFLWLGGTAWEMLHRLSKEDIKFYLTDRKEKGFNVIQTVILAELNGLNEPNYYGHKPLINNDPTQLNEAYFQLVDDALHQADSLGIYIALLPTWGDKFNKKWGAGPEIFTPENAYIYGKLLAERYKTQQNIIWILGGDRVPENEVHYQLIRKMAAGIRSVDTVKLISYHPSGAKRATEYFNDRFLDFDMFQSGHSSESLEYQYVLASKKTNPLRPVVNGEARYEHIPDRFWETENHGFLNDYDVRVSAYWSIMAGAAGYTYGCNEIWQMYDNNRQPIINASVPWKETLQYPGAKQISYIKKLFSDYPIQEFLLADTLVTLNSNDTNHIIACWNNLKNTALIYLPTYQEININPSFFHAKKVNTIWYNPRTGNYVQKEKYRTNKLLQLSPPENMVDGDYVLILTE